MLALLLFLSPKVSAATGTNKQISFQGKVVNTDGTNVANDNYDFEFKLYSVSTGGTAIWTETRITTNQVTVTDGVFQVNLGSVTALPGDVDFNTDNIYLGINFNSNGEMEPRVRFTAVPQAFNALKVAGLTVTDTTGTLTVTNAKTLTVSDSTTLGTNAITLAGGEVITFSATNALSLLTTGSTSVTLPTSGTLVNSAVTTLSSLTTVGSLVSGTVIGSQTFTTNNIADSGALTLSSGGSSGLTFDSASGDITVAANDGLTFAATTLGNNGSRNITINSGTGGTTATLIVKLDTSGTVITTDITILNNAVGVALNTTTIGQAVRVAINGVVTATADNAVTAGDYIGLGTTTAGRAKSLGTTYPTTAGVQVIGRALGSQATPGSTFLLMLNGLDNNVGTGGGGSSLFTDAGTFTYLTSTADDLILGASTVAAAPFFMDVSAGLLYLGTNEVLNGGLTFYSSGAGKTDPTIAANAAGDLTLSAPSGKVVVGAGSGNIKASLTGETDVLLADKIVTLTAANSLTDFTFNRVLTGGANNQGGTVFLITDTSGGAGTINPDMLVVNSALTSGTFTGNLLRLQVGGTDKFAVGSDGKLTISGATTDITTAATENLTLTAGTTGDVIVSGDADTNFQVSFSAAPTVDMASITNSGFGTTTTGVDGLTVTFVQATGGTGETNTGINVDVTGSSDSGDTLSGVNITTNAISAGTVKGVNIAPANVTGGTLYGIQIGNITGSGSATEYALVIGTGWDRGLSVSSASTFTAALTSESTATIGTGGNTFTFNPASGPVYAGTARPSKVIILSSEYAGATLTADGSSTTNGSMTSDNTLNAASIGWKNYYSWSSTQAALQDYTVAVRVTLPQDFDGWQTGSCPSSTCALEIAYQTGVAGTTNNAVSVLLNNAETTPGTVICTIAAASSTTWTSFGCTSTTLATSPTWNTAGSVAIIRIKLAANSTASALARAGDITLRYLSKF